MTTWLAGWYGSGEDKLIAYARFNTIHRAKEFLYDEIIDRKHSLRRDTLLGNTTGSENESLREFDRAMEGIDRTNADSFEVYADGLTFWVELAD